MNTNATKKNGAPPAGPCTLVIFGASGDLTKRKLIPALYNLARQKLLPEAFSIIGIARNPFTTDSFRAQISSDVRELSSAAFDSGLWDGIVSRLYYLSGEFDDPATYHKLADELARVEKDHGTRGNVLFYLATAPDFFALIPRHLSEAGLTKESDDHWIRVIVEKPFGRDLASALKLNGALEEVLEEKQIYRIDHYLGKETVQNILVFRLANGIFEHLWNAKYIDHVQITVAETLGVEQRGGYYDHSGALRDMVPNHIFQLITLTAMEPPISFDADAVRDEQVKVLRAMKPLSDEDVLTHTVRGQYAAGVAGDRKLPNYRAEKDVDPHSNTETFAAIQLAIDNWRWTGVPFYLRVGKAMKKRDTEIVVQFKQPPFTLFRNTGVEELSPNQLVINVQPDEGISLSFGAKVPGATVTLGEVLMNFRYADYFGSTPATGYERLLYDAMCGDQTLFQRADMVEAAWKTVDPVLAVWQALPARSFPNYAAGSWGPKDADALLERDGRRWRVIE
jgi:glucose-6-phosphate 1-dehydrogenase